MEKNFTSFLYGAICYFCLFVNKGFSQVRVEGQLVKENSMEAVEGVLLGFKELSIKKYSNKEGHFVFQEIPKGSFTLELSCKGYQSKIFPLTIEGKGVLDLGVLVLYAENTEVEETMMVSLSEDDLENEEVGGANNISGLLFSSKDVFLRTAAFSFSQARFKIRGYDSREGAVLINGVSMNKMFDGRPQWSNWGGLNNMMRNQYFTLGLQPSEITFGSVLGTTHISTKVSEYRPGTSVSYVAANGSYQGRIMASFVSNFSKKGWGLAISASRRFAQEGYIEGTTYNAWSGFLAVEKKFNSNQRLNFTALMAFNRRGKSSANTKEVSDVKGYQYNSYWGFQEGALRNSRVKEVSEPVLMLHHDWKINNTTELASVMYYQFGHIGNSRLGMVNATSPDPTYYKKLPSYYLRFQENPDYSTAYLSLKSFEEDGQINWQKMYKVNTTTNSSNYYLYEDRNDDVSMGVNINLRKEFAEHTLFTGAIFYKKVSSHNYAKVLDDLGGGGFLDVDSFAETSVQENNVHTPDRFVTEGAIFQYNYTLELQEANLFTQLQSAYKSLDYYVSMDLKNTAFYRVGHYENGKYIGNSLGVGKQNSFLDFSLKGGGVYKISGRHLIDFNVGYLSRPPNLRNSYTNVRLNHDVAPKLNSEKIYTGDITYSYRAPNTLLRLTGYHTLFSNVIESSFSFSQGLQGDISDFVSQTLTGIQKRHMGLELGIQRNIHSTVVLNTVLAVGNYSYANNPNLYVNSDLLRDQDQNFGTAYLKGYKLGGSPQRALSVGIEYRDPKYWWIGVNGNILTNNYVQVSPLLRTDNFFLDIDEIPFVSEATGSEVSQEEVDVLLTQEKFQDVFLVNLVGGKSWKINETYLSFFGSINNVFNAVYKTGGYEQSRNANYEQLVKDKKLQSPIFGNKYWYGYGTTSYLMLSLRF